MTPRILAVDLDGTLLDSTRKLRQPNIDAIRRARDAGIEVVLASGRLLTSMRPFAAQLELDGPFICCNGAHMVDEAVELMHLAVDREVFRRTCAYCLENRVHLNA